MTMTLKRRLSDEKGAMERVLVTILLVIIGVGLFLGLSAWVTTQNSQMTDVATIEINKVVSDTSSN